MLGFTRAGYLLLALGVCMGTAFIFFEARVPQESPVTTEPSGKIYLTVGLPATSVLHSRVLDVVTGKITNEGIDESSLGYFYTFSRAGDMIAFVGTTKEMLDAAKAGTTSATSAFQLYHTSVAKPLPTPTHAQQVTQLVSGGLWSPSISPDGSRILYMTRAPVITETSSPADFTVHLTTSGADTELTHGNFAQWYTNTTFIYIAEDGVRTYDIATKQSILLLPMHTAANTKLALSPDGTLLSLSNPDARKVFIYKITTPLSLASLDLLKELDTLGFWAVFSSDSHYITVQTAAEDPQTQQLTGPRLDFYNTQDFAPARESVPLHQFSNDSLWVSGWEVVPKKVSGEISKHSQLASIFDSFLSSSFFPLSYFLPSSFFGVSDMKFQWLTLDELSMPTDPNWSIGEYQFVYDEGGCLNHPHNFYYQAACRSVPNACGMRGVGFVYRVDLVGLSTLSSNRSACSAAPVPDAACPSVSASCHAGQVLQGGVCVLPQSPVAPPLTTCASNQGALCTAANSCGVVSTGTIACNGSCATTAGLPQGFGTACTVPTTCGASPGRINCNGSCNVSRLNTCPGVLILGDQSDEDLDANGNPVPHFGCAAHKVRIKALPLLFHSGKVSAIQWLANEAKSCVVTGNGETFTGLQGVQVTKPITSKTKYTITCQPMAQCSGPPFSSSVEIGILPNWQEI